MSFPLPMWPERLADLDGVSVQDTAPDSPADLDVWLDTSEDPPVWNVWDEGTTTWVVVGGSGGGGSEIVFPPSYTPTEGGDVLDLSVLYVFGIGGGEPYYNASGVAAGDEAVLVLDGSTGELALRPVEVS